VPSRRAAVWLRGGMKGESKCRMPFGGEMTRGDGRTRVGIANTEATHDDLTLAHGGNGQPATVV